jgi:hypothetical protein
MTTNEALERVTLWKSLLDAVPTVELWNEQMPLLVQQHGVEFKHFAQAEAAARGYLWSKDSRQYLLPWNMTACRGRNVIGAGWRQGQLAVVFAAKEGHRRYESVGEVPREVFEKLSNSPFPDKLYTQIVVGKFKMQRIF